MNCGVHTYRLLDLISFLDKGETNGGIPSKKTHNRN
jgi:hypothetical protein